MKKNPFADLPSLMREPSLEFLSNREVTVEGSRGVLSYSEDQIRVNTEGMTLCFFGRNLNLKCISPSALVISGFIMKLEFEF
ncbi:MAG: YabP/YqfC family sporulation protein [Ruminococcus sp.]|nr:YabP/YqfC family sporulation protein [Ruminococcus sp.]